MGHSVEPLSVNRHRPSLLLALCFTALCMSLHSVLMVWVIILTLCALGAQLGLYFSHQQHPIATRQVNLLAILSLLALAWFGMSIGLLNSMINLLVIACALKLLQLNAKRDFLQLFSACLFLLGCGFIFNLSVIAWLGYVLLSMSLLVCLRMLFVPSQSLVSGLKHISVLLLQSAPIALMLFIVIPQFPPLWQMPTSKTQQTGLAESVTPGDIAALAQSSALAFTATFDGSPPPRAIRYWRAMTMEAFDGKTWSISEKRRQAERQLNGLGKTLTLPNKKVTAYQVIIEPTHQRYIYALDLSSIAEPLRNNARVQFDFTIRSSTPIASKRAILLNHHQNATPVSPIEGFDSQLNLLYPKNTNPKTEAWAANVARKYQTPQDVAAHIMGYFATQNFVYTLTPSTMPIAPIDTFLFNERGGFCAHYASAMAFALRVAGIPARLVTGYQGGEQLTGRALQLRQYDAHAWVEALIDGTWVRYDPTGMVAPSRISRGLTDALNSLGQNRDNDMFDAMQETVVFNAIQSLFRQLDYQWSRWVLGFDNQQQKSLLASLLKELSSRKMSFFFIGVLVLIALVLALYFLPLSAKKTEPKETAIYKRAAKLVERHTRISRHTLPAHAYYEQVKDRLPEAARETFQQLTQHFQLLRYTPHTHYRNQCLAQMINQLKQLKKQLD
jgi:transglutaminase-like putative cysteine protease